jgi:hypothetical protein
MKLEQITKHASLYQIAKLLDMTPPATYKWKKAGIPPLRVYQLKELKPEWFKELSDEAINPNQLLTNFPLKTAVLKDKNVS